MKRSGVDVYKKYTSKHVKENASSRAILRDKNVYLEGDVKEEGRGIGERWEEK